jgi:hypothetical protein
MYLGAYEKVVEKEHLWELFVAPSSATPQPVPLATFEASDAKRARLPWASTVDHAHVFDIYFLSHSPPPSLSDLFWLLELCPQNELLSIYSVLCTSWLAVYQGCSSPLAFGLPSLLVLRL